MYGGVLTLMSGTVKAYIRKASVLFALREYTKALEALDVAREHDEAAGSKSTREIQELSFKIQSAISAQRANETEQETMERAMRDPEVAVRVNNGDGLLYCMLTSCCFCIFRRLCPTL